MLLLVLLLPLLGEFFWPIHKWLGYWYLVFQLVELVARDSLDMTDTLKDHAFSLLPALAALVMTALWFASALVLPPKTVEVLNFWHAIAWLDFLVGVGISIRILTSPYRREES